MMTTSSTDDILALVNWDAVAEAIRAEPVEHWDYEDAAKMTWNVASRYFVKDLATYSHVLAIEEEFGVEYVYREDGSGSIHGFIDLTLELPGGEVDIVDWKTAGDLGRDWSEHLADSWQWRIYVAVTSAARVLYRGLDKSKLAPKIPGQPYDWGKAPMKELVFEATGRELEAVQEYIVSAGNMRAQLEFRGGRWPRRMPDGCTQFGTRCGHYEVCRDRAPLPTGKLPAKPWSYSGLGRFFNCPEHWRLDVLTGKRTSSRATNLGSAVHRGVAAVYGQFNDIKARLAAQEAVGA